MTTTPENIDTSAERVHKNPIAELMQEAAEHLTVWLELNLCECEGGHHCGYYEVERTRDALLFAAEQQPSPVVQEDPVAWIYSLGDQHAVELRHYRDDELVDGCVVTPLYAHPQPAPDVSALVEALEDIAQWSERWAFPGHPVATIARKALAAFRQGGGE